MNGLRIIGHFALILLLFSCSKKETGNNETIQTIDADETVVGDDTEVVDEMEVANETELVETSPNKNHSIIDFRSELRPGKTDWNEKDIFIDTLELIEFNQDYDYAFAVFKNAEGATTTIYSHDQIDNALQGKNFVVNWKVGSFSEAGEGEALYFHEQMISFELLP